MDRYEEMLDEIDREGVAYFSVPMLHPVHALYIRDEGQPVIAVDERLSSREKLCASAEEMGHHHTTQGNLMYVTPREYTRQERRARGWAYGRLAPLDMIAEAYCAAGPDPEEMADALGVTPAFLAEAIAYYRERYGVSWQTQQFAVRFIPLFCARRR